MQGIVQHFPQGSKEVHQPGLPAPVSCVPHLDKLSLALRRKPSNAIQRQMKQLCGAPRSTRKPTDLRKHGHKSRWGYMYPWIWTLFQPSPRALQLADEFLEAQPGYVFGVEVALELDYKTSDQRDEALAFFRRHAIQSHHGQRRLSDLEDTTYWGPRSTNRQLVSYRRPTGKYLGGPVVRIEYRFRGKATIARQGFERLDTLARLDWQLWWESHLRLESLDLLKLSRQLLRRSKSKSPAPPVPHLPHLDVERYWAARLARLGRSDATENFATQRLKDALRGHRWVRWESCSELLNWRSFVPRDNLHFPPAPRHPHSIRTRATPETAQRQRHKPKHHNSKGVARCQSQPNPIPY